MPVTSSDRGTSLISAMVAISLMTLAVGFGAGIVRSAAAAANRYVTTLIRSATLARFDVCVVGALSRIRQPPWLPGPAFQQTDSQIALQYLDGDVAQEVRIGWNDSGAFVTAAGETMHYPGLSIREARFVPDPPAHLLLTMAGVDGSLAPLAAPLGAAPLPPP